MELTTTFPLSSLLVLDTKVPSIEIDLHLALEWPMVWSRIPFATANFAYIRAVLELLGPFFGLLHLLVFKIQVS